MTNTLQSRFLLGSYLLFICTAGCAHNIKTDSIITKKVDQTVSNSKNSVSSFQIELLDIGFDAATAIPVEPHIKDRSLAQQRVVEVALRLDQPQIAEKYISKIENWRRGAAYADLALYLAQHGKINEVQGFLDRAEKIANDAEDWRKDNINVKIAKTYTLLGKQTQAEALEKGVADSETGKVARAKAMLANVQMFDDEVKSLDAMITSGKFDLARNALDAYAEFFNRFYSDINRRSLVEQKIQGYLSRIPIFVQIELLLEMSGFALDHSDRGKALVLVNQAQSLMDKSQWPLEYRLQLTAKLIAKRFQAGDHQKAQTDADALLVAYDAGRMTIVNIDRAGALRPLAEAYQSMGNRAAALAVYKKALREGIENPNSRPRAEDLSATCSSMALHGVEPDSDLWAQIYKIRQGLSDPW